MFKVSMEKECTCFKRSKFLSEQKFQTQEEAHEVATLMAKEMTRDFCKNHAFCAIKEDDDYIILLMS
ncbi:hypothetical protein JHD50_13435 [Sulfurimonas sp. MAG313]|nr:hypothetical protein [Sulfurimonas sp. MAG313]MDF1882291.1 hypothetical protein [Sulfurimonas sp. MAG313]